MTWYWAALLVVVLLFVFMALGVPVAFSLGLTAAVATFFLLGPKLLINVANIAFEKGADNLFIVAPLFIFMAAVVAYSGVAEQAFTAAHRWLNRMPGALASSSLVACTAFAAISGSSPATSATVGYFAIPEMLRHGYNRRLAAGTIAAGGTLGILIPPSVTMILYGIITETSIAKLFIAGILPGLMLSGLMIAYTTLVATLKPDVAPAAPRFTWRERFTSLKGIWGVLFLFMAVLGSIYFGIATPSESAAIGAGGALLLTWLTGRMTWARLWEATTKSARVTAMVMFLIFGGFTLSYVVSSLGIGHGLARLLLDSGLRPWTIMIGYNILLMLLGTLMEPAAMMVLTLPILFPVFLQMGFDPVWLGVIITINAELGMITPPFGLNLFVLKSVVPSEVQLSDIVLGSLPYAVVLLLGLALVMAFPEIALVLPALSR